MIFLDQLSSLPPFSLFLWAGMLSLIWGLCLFPVPVHTCSGTSTRGGLAGVLLCFSIGIWEKCTRTSAHWSSILDVWRLFPLICVSTASKQEDFTGDQQQNGLTRVFCGGTFWKGVKDLYTTWSALCDRHKLSLVYRSRCLQRCQCVLAITPPRPHIWDLFPPIESRSTRYHWFSQHTLSFGVKQDAVPG